MIWKCCLVFTVLATGLAHAAADAPEGGRSVLPGDWLKASAWMGDPARATAARVSFDGGRSGWRVVVPDAEAGRYSLQLTVPVTASVAEGETMLLSFDARCVPDASEQGKGALLAVVELKEPPSYKKLLHHPVEFGTAWTTVHVPFRAETASKDGVTALSLMPGGRRQTLELANVRLLTYGADFPLAKLPRQAVTYPGREADAPWRKEALARIERLRTTDVGVEVVDAAGKPLVGASVDISLRRHAFAFGAAVRARWMQTDEAYRRTVDENFSAIVLENDLKPFAWEEGASNDATEHRRDWALRTMAWARERGFRVRGHYLAWGPWEKWSEALRDTPQAIRDKVMAHTDEIIRAAGPLVTEWDAVNHPVGWESPRRTVDQAVGADFYADVFREARARTGLPLFINEDQVFRPGRQQDEFHECIRQLIARGVRPDGIGNQAHFDSTFLPAPEEMWRISDRFAALVPNLELTEFDVVTNGDEQLQADWLRDVLILTYSHPAYTGMLLWVFWEGAAWKPEAALWRQDWSLKPNGEVWRQLVGGAWKTQAQGTTDAAGNFRARGHRGLYEVTVRHGGREVRQPWDTEAGRGALRVVW